MTTKSFQDFPETAVHDEPDIKQRPVIVAFLAPVCSFPQEPDRRWPSFSFSAFSKSCCL